MDNDTSPSVLSLDDGAVSDLFLKRMRDWNASPSVLDEVKLMDVFDKVEQAVKLWINQHGSYGLLCTYGSYGLQVHTGNSDLDLMVLVPGSITLEDFFNQFAQTLKISVESSNMKLLRRAKVPLIKIMINGIPVDIGCCRVAAVHKDLVALKATDSTSALLLSSLEVNTSLYAYFPGSNERQRYVDVVRFIKFWCKQRGIYGNLIGYLGGVHIATLVAYACRGRPDLTLPELILNFFCTFKSWMWPDPVVLDSAQLPLPPLRLLMPIQKPGSCDYLQSNTRGNMVVRIEAEFQRAYSMMERVKLVASNGGQMMATNLSLSLLVEKIDYKIIYQDFIKIKVWGPEEWTGLIESQFPFLLNELESMGVLSDPNMQHTGNSPRCYNWGVQKLKTRTLEGLEGLEESFKHRLQERFSAPPDFYGDYGLNISF